jgi:hypothetical protein
MPTQQITDRQLDAFRRFLRILPHGKDVELVILKAHLLIEEQVRQIVDERLKNPTALADARLGCHQAICVAQSFFPADRDLSLWAGLKKLNKLRNDIAHNLEPKQLQNHIEEFIGSFPTGVTDGPDEAVRFELVLWSLFVAVSDLVERPSAQVLELVPRNES